MAQSESIAALAAALCEAQFALESAQKDSLNPHFRSRYADLASVWNAARPALHKHGLSVVQAPEPCDNGIRLRTILLHKSGEWIDSVLTLPASRQDAQGYGSAMTYARRYALAAMVGIVADDDDDGNAASGITAQRRDEAPAATENSDGPSDKQNGMIRHLREKLHWEKTDLADFAREQQIDLHRLTKRSASELIERMQAVLNGEPA